MLKLQKNIRSGRWLTGLTVAAMLLILSVQTARAHARDVVGDYIFVLGWLSEPPLVGERNTIFLEIERESTGQPVTGAEGALSTTIIYADQSLRVNLVPVEDEPGIYHIDLIPTVRGTYSIEIVGTLEETEIDLLLDADEVFPPLRLQFPETAPDALTLQSEMQEQIDLLTADLQTARILAIVGPVIAVISLILGALGLRKASQSGE